MQKKLSQFVRLLFALIVAVGTFAPIGVNAQPPIEPRIGPAIAEAKIDDHVPTIAEAKQREPRLMSEAEQAKAYGVGGMVGVGVTVERKRVRVRAFNMALIF